MEWNGIELRGNQNGIQTTLFRTVNGHIFVFHFYDRAACVDWIFYAISFSKDSHSHSNKHNKYSKNKFGWRRVFFVLLIFFFYSTLYISHILLPKLHAYLESNCMLIWKCIIELLWLYFHLPFARLNTMTWKLLEHFFDWCKYQPKSYLEFWDCGFF